MKKALLNIITIVALFFMAAPVMAAYELEQGPESYPDLPSDHWAYEAVTFLTDKKIVVGYPDGLYRPDQKVTRAEFATIVTKALGLRDLSEITYTTYKDIDEIDTDVIKAELVRQCDVFITNIRNGTFDVQKVLYQDKPLLIFIIPVTIERAAQRLAVGVMLNSKGETIYRIEYVSDLDM